MVDIVLDRATLDLGDSIFCGNIRDGVLAGMFIKNDRDIVSKAEKITNAVNARLDDFESKLKDNR